MARSGGVSVTQPVTVRSWNRLERPETWVTHLAHANRVATMGQLTASVANEVKQPITGVAVNAEAARLWLARRPPALEEAQQALGRIVKCQ